MVRIIEVGPRDGLQNEAVPIPTPAKAAFIGALADAGLKEIEVSSFVSPKWVPQLGDAAELFGQLSGRQDALFSALVPNLKGLERAIEVGVKRIALFTAASEAFTKKNINMSIDESVAAFRDVVQAFREQAPNGFVRGYVSTAFECPYSGPVSPSAVADVSMRLIELGVDEISLGDTIGVAVPNDVRELHQAMLDVANREKIVWHFHDTRGTAISNVAAALELGYRAFDSSAAGLGGCPYAPGAGGNLSTEDLVYFLERSGEPTGVDLQKLSQASLPILQALGRKPAGRAQVAALAG